MSNDLSAYDKSKYKLTIVPSASRNKAFQLGEPITVKWEAPHQHSRKDWIGLYRVNFYFPLLGSAAYQMLVRSGRINLRS